MPLSIHGISLYFVLWYFCFNFSFTLDIEHFLRPGVHYPVALNLLSHTGSFWWTYPNGMQMRNAVLWAGLSLALLCFYHFLLTLNRIAWGLSVHSLATPWLCSAFIITPVESSLKIVIVISIFVNHFQQFQLLLSVDNWLLEMFSCKCFIVNTDYILNMIWFNFYFWIVSNFSFLFFFLINFFLN